MKLIDLVTSKIKKASTRRMLAGALGLLLALALLVSFSIPALAVLMPPHQFWGDVTIGGAPAPAGTPVKAEVRGTEWFTTVDAMGRYGYTPSFRVLADDPDTGAIEGGRNGDTVNFYVGGVPATSYTFEIGGTTELPLAVTGPDITPPTVTSKSPASGATGVAISTTVSATFSEALDVLTITTSSFTLKAGTTPVSGSVSYNSGTYTATFTPAANLSYSTTYTATLSTAIKDVSGNPLASPYSWSFTTAVSTVVPGDANGDGLVNTLDITKVERIIALLDAPTPGADANQDGNINALDITKIERIIAGLP